MNTPVLSTAHLERTDGWGQVAKALNYVYRPTSVAGIQRVLKLAHESGRSVGLRGGGISYGDASLNAENILLDLSRMTRILDWNPETGVIDVEAGVTMRDLWRYIVGDGWWPSVVPGTMFGTIGGSLAMNVHGKNHWQSGTLGDYTLEFDAVLPTGELITCDPEETPDLFYSIISGFGMFAIITRAKLQMKRIFSGRLKTTSRSADHLHELLTLMDTHKDASDYMVGWVDCFAKGDKLGRGQVDTSNALSEGADPQALQTLRLAFQDVSDTIAGIIPKSILWRAAQLVTNNFGIYWANVAKFWAGKLQHGNQNLNSYAAANFMLDYVPHWKKAYLPGGLLQHQCFLPYETSETAIRSMLALCQQRGYPSYLGVIKRHPADDNFLMAYSLDGFSLAMDFRVTKRNKNALLQLMHDLDQLVVEAGGRFYLAKDAHLRPDAYAASLGDTRMKKMLALKQQYDPQNVLQTNLSRRLLLDHLTTV